MIQDTVLKLNCSDSRPEVCQPGMQLPPHCFRSASLSLRKIGIYIKNLYVESISPNILPCHQLPNMHYVDFSILRLLSVLKESSYQIQLWQALMQASVFIKSKDNPLFMRRPMSNSSYIKLRN